MKQSKKIINPKLAALASFLAAGGILLTVTGLVREGTLVSHYEAMAPKNNYTVLVYMDGSDLESDYGAARDDLIEMQSALAENGITEDNARIVVEAGGAASWQYDAMQNDTYARFCLTSEGITNFTSMDTRNMGLADTLTDFLNYGTEAYPSDKYGVVLWNHGSGQISGFGSDSNYEDDTLTLAELDKAFSNADWNGTFEFISLDACLMGNIEMVSTLYDESDYLIASEDLEPQNGYDYSWLSVLKSTTDARVIGKKMLETYAASYQNNNYRITLSLMDMRAYENFSIAFQQMIKGIEWSDTSYQRLGEERTRLQGFGSRTSNGTSDIVDMAGFIDIVEVITTDTLAIQQLKDAYSALIMDSVSQGYQPAPSGLSIYLPSGANEWLATDMKEYQNIIFCDTYKTFAENYKIFLEKENHMDWQTPTTDQNEIIMETDIETIQNIVAVYLVTFCTTDSENDIYLISSDSDVVIGNNGYLKATPENVFWGMQGTVLCMLEISNTNQITEYMVPILFNQERCNMIIEFSEDSPDGKILSIAPVETSKREYEIKEGDVITALYPLEQTGEVNRTEEMQQRFYDNSYYRGEDIIINSIANGDAELERITIDNSNCLYGFMIQDNKQKLYYTEVSGL